VKGGVAAALGLGLLASAGLGCAPPRAEEARVLSVVPAVRRVETARLGETVNELISLHQFERPLDCVALLGFEESWAPYSPACHLTRHAARALMRLRLEELGLQVREHTATDGVLETTNVIADLRGTTHPEEVVLVGAHFDAFYAAADDNSSGVAAVLEAARVLSQQRHARTLRFVGFDLEELGLIGSARLVDGGFSGERLVAALVLDAIAYADPREGAQTAPLGMPVPERGDFIAVVGNDLSRPQAGLLRELASMLDLVPTELVLAPGLGASPLASDLLRSDHAPFWLAGHPAVFLTDTADFRNPHYHRPSDTLGTLDPTFFTQVTRLVVAGLAYWAEVQR
jgi:hypothetical protein